MRKLLVLTAMLALTGCMEFTGIKPVAETDKSFYVVDTKYMFLCRGLSQDCQEMSLIASGRMYYAEIENAYGQKLRGPNYPRSLARMMMKPADGSYVAKAIDENGRYYRLPINEKTNKVWRTLGDIHRWVYSD
mgnify:CR=1 FL=1